MPNTQEKVEYSFVNAKSVGSSNLKSKDKKKVETKGTIKLLRVYRNSIAEIRIRPSSQLLMKFFKNNSFDVLLSNRERVDYYIFSQDNETGIIEISLNFRNIKNVSHGNEPETLEVSLNKKII